MPYVDWSMKGEEFSACNCDFGCPCQFNARPTHDNCRAVVSMQIESGHFGDTDLSGIKWVGTLAWPGAIHEGSGEAQIYIDENTSDDQRNALLTILSGQETAPGATIFQVFSTTLSNMHEPQFVPITLEIDRKNKIAKTVIKDVISVTGESIKNPITGMDHHVSVTLPEGFEYTHADYASATIDAKGRVEVDTENSHGHFCHIHMTQHGVQRPESSA